MSLRGVHVDEGQWRCMNIDGGGWNCDKLKTRVFPEKRMHCRREMLRKKAKGGGGGEEISHDAERSFKLGALKAS